MKNTLFDTQSATKSALFGGEAGWYDAFWLGERRPSAGYRRVIRITGLLRETITAIRVRLSVRHGQVGKVLAVTRAAMAPFDFVTQSQRLETRDK